MNLRLIDILIICVYLASTVIIGIVLRKKAQSSKSSYLLGGNELPWYLLGLSNASGMFDISGTMWLVALMFLYGLKSIWIPWLWPIFNQVFLMVYLSAWLRRSNVTTGAEWMGTRFGNDKGSRLSHNIVVVFALISCLGFLAYGFVGLGKFVMIFIPWEIVQPYVPFHVAPQYVPHLYGLIFTAVAIFYTVIGGMMSIVWADLIQYSIMTVSSIFIGIMAMNALTGHELLVPDGWKTPFFGWALNMDWSGIVAEANAKIASDGYSLFSLFVGMLIFKGVLVSAAGPAPNYDMQKILATKNPREAAKMSGFVSVVLNPVRYFMIAGFGVLAVLFYDKLDLMVAGKVDFEQILPSAINQFAPVGILGLLLAGLLAAFNSTFAGTLNAAQAYVINDIYLKYINPRASQQSVKKANYLTGIIIVAISIIFGVFAKNINSILVWIVSGLWGGYIAANVLKWYWWRFNGQGYFWGMLTGMIPALIFPKLLPHLFPSISSDIILLYFFPVLLIISAAGCVAGTLLTKPTDEETLKKFYKTVRPWGFWKPIHEKVVAEDPGFEKNKNFKRDMFNVFVGVVAQTALVALPIFIVIKQWNYLIVTLVITVVACAVLKKTWYDTLES